MTNTKIEKAIEEFKIHIFPHGVVIERKEFDDMEICKTLEEAVANLWLELNKE